MKPEQTGEIMREYREQERARARRMTVFYPTKLVNPTNRREHWSVRASRTKAHRVGVAMTIRSLLAGPMMARFRHFIQDPSAPKVITFTAHLTRLLDTDGLVAACKSVRDGLQDCGVIHEDGPGSGHEFHYDQRVAKPTGVTILIALR